MNTQNGQKQKETDINTKINENWKKQTKTDRNGQKRMKTNIN